jgi:hypothetical protein
MLGDSSNQIKSKWKSPSSGGARGGLFDPKPNS